MHTYYADLSAIEQQTRQLEHEQCRHCQRTHLVSHGFVYKKQSKAKPRPVGKRVFCSNRRRHTGCGRTMRLYLASTVRALHYAGAQLVAFVLALIAGMTVRQAYRQATGCADPRHAWRWLNRFDAQLSLYRSLAHQPPLHDTDTPTVRANRPARYRLLASTFGRLLQQFGQPLCERYQCDLQRSFLAPLTALPSLLPNPNR